MCKHLIAFFMISSAQVISQLPPASTSATDKTTTAGPPTAKIETVIGTMTCTLFPDNAPIGVEHFIGLARGTRDRADPTGRRPVHSLPFYSGTIFNRVIPKFMIQGGEPMVGAPGDKFKKEISSELRFDRPGRLAYAVGGPDTNSTQFFITEVAAPSLNGQYTIFGQCDDASVELVKKIARIPHHANGYPYKPVKINRIIILNWTGLAPIAPARETGRAPAPEASEVRHFRVIIKPLYTTDGVPYGCEARKEETGALLATGEQISMEGDVLVVEETQYNLEGTVVYKGKLFFDGPMLLREEIISGTKRWTIFHRWDCWSF